MKTLNIYSRLENTMIEILGNIYDDSEERNNLNKNITNSIRKLRVIRKIVEKHRFDNHKEIIKKHDSDKFTKPQFKASTNSSLNITVRL